MQKLITKNVTPIPDKVYKALRIGFEIKKILVKMMIIGRILNCKNFCRCEDMPQLMLGFPTSSGGLSARIVILPGNNEFVVKTRDHTLKQGSKNRVWGVL